MTSVQKTHIRLADFADIPFLKDVEQSASRAFHVLPDYVVQDYTVPTAILKHMVEEKMLWVAVSDDQQPVGFVGCRDMDDLLYVHEISVAFDFQKRGIGRRLMATIIEHAGRVGYAGVGLTTRRDAVWNMPFYQTLGFAEVANFEACPALYRQIEQELAEGADPSVRCAMILMSAPADHAFCA